MRAGGSDWSAAAEAAAETVLGSPQVAPLFAMMCRVGLAALATARDDAAAATALYHSLKSQQGTAIFPLALAADRLLASLASTAGRHARARQHFERALAFCHRAGYRAEYARTARDYAETLQALATDPGRAGQLLEESFVIASELGITALVEDVQGKS
jgi:hypothetical protein